MAYTEKRLAELKGWMENVIEHDVERQYIKSFLKESIQQAVAEERDQAYTSLVEGIDGMKSDPTLPADDALYSRSDIDREVDKTLTDIIQKVVKPLYGKE